MAMQASGVLGVNANDLGVLFHVVLSRTLPVGSRHCTLRVIKIKRYMVNFLTTRRSDFGMILMAMLWVCAAH